MSRKNIRLMIRSLFILLVAGINLMLGIIFVYAVQGEPNLLLMALIISTVLVEAFIFESARISDSYEKSKYR